LFMCPVATTSATHQAHKFSSLLPHIDLTTASSKEPMNPFKRRTHTSIGAMTATNFVLGSDFRWPLLGVALPWIVALSLYAIGA